MAKVNLTLLGGFRLQTDSGEPVPLSTKKAGALLAYLALHSGQAQARPKLAALLWGDHSEVQARDSLRQALSLLRKALSRVDPRALMAHEDTISLKTSSLATDAIIFGDLVAQPGADSLEQAVALYGGELLEGFQVAAPEFESWATAERERFREMALGAMTRLLDHHLSAGAVEAGIRIAARLLAADPLQERVHRSLMELYCRQGRHGAALRQYRTCADVLAKELRIEPDATTKALRREILREWNQQQGTTSRGEAAVESLCDVETEPPNLALPDRPSIAVLPFQNMSGDPEQEYFADGMVEDIITALSRFKQLFVIARNSSFTYRGKAVDVKQVARELGVRYVLEGAVRKSGSRMRITGQLIDGSTGAQLWADRFDSRLEEIFDLQEQVAATVAGEIAPRMERAEIERIKRKPTESLDAYDYYLRGMAIIPYAADRESTLAALQFFEKALEHDQDFALAHAAAAYCYVWLKVNRYMLMMGEQEVAATLRHVSRAVERGQDDASALGLAGLALAYVGFDLDGAVSLLDKALKLNPNLASAWHWSGWVRCYLGEPDTAIEHLARAMRLSPLDPLFYGMEAATAFAHFLAGRYEEAISWADKACLAGPQLLSSWHIAAASNALAGNREKAQQAVHRVLQISPAVRVSLVKYRLPLRRPEDLARFEEGLRKAGYPE
jgi:TolB-like protein/Tfp pilus assembly protein PilF